MPKGQKLQLPEEEIVRQYQAGDGTEKIAERYGCSTAPIYRILKEYGVAMHPRGRPDGVKDSPEPNKRSAGQLRRRRRDRLLGTPLHEERTEYCSVCEITVRGSTRFVLRHLVQCKSRARSAA
jgi:hypothetical protein